MSRPLKLSTVYCTRSSKQRDHKILLWLSSTMMKLPLPFLFLAIVSSWQQPHQQLSSVSRRQWLASTLADCVTVTATATVTSTTPSAPSLVSIVGATATTSVVLTASHTPPAGAAPPIAIIAQELGYFPVTNSKGETVYIPKRVSRESSDQAMALAHHLRNIKARVYETYWCPHSARQRELFGRQAWDVIDHVECSPKGYRAQPTMCNSKRIDGYPTWIIRGKVVSGERSLSELAKASAFPGNFVEALELNVPPSLGSSSCR